MMYVNLIWVWGHPEVYILVLPAFGIFSEVMRDILRQAAVRLSLDGAVRRWRSACCPTSVWLHHFFTMGAGASVNAFFGITTHDHRGADGCQNLQLAVHDVRRSRSIHGADAVDDRIHGDVRLRRHDRRAAGVAAGRLAGTQQPVSGRSFPHVIIPRRPVRRHGGIQLLVSQRRSASGWKNAGARRRSGAGSSVSISLSCRSTWSG